jgi:hypothetical protein
MGQQFWLLWKNISLNKSSPRDCFSICTHTFYSTSLLVATKDQCIIIYPTTFLFSSNWYCKNALQFQRILNNYNSIPTIWQMAHQPMCWRQTSVMLGNLHHRSAICRFYSLNNPLRNSKQRFSETLTVTLLCYSWQRKLVSPVMKLLFPC